MNSELIFTDGSRWTDLLMAVVLSSYFKMFVFAMMVRHRPTDALWFLTFRCTVYFQSTDSKWMAGLGVFTSNGTYHWHACIVIKYRGFKRYGLRLRSPLTVLSIKTRILANCNVVAYLHCFIFGAFFDVSFVEIFDAYIETWILWKALFFGWGLTNSSSVLFILSDVEYQHSDCCYCHSCRCSLPNTMPVFDRPSSIAL